MPEGNTAAHGHLAGHDGRDLAPDFDDRAGLETTAHIVEDGLAPA
jgi:hypothetical protein